VGWLLVAFLRILSEGLWAAVIGIAIDEPVRSAAQKNSEEFEKADANSMNAWKYFPF